MYSINLNEWISFIFVKKKKYEKYIELTTYESRVIQSKFNFIYVLKNPNSKFLKYGSTQRKYDVSKIPQKNTHISLTILTREIDMSEGEKNHKKGGLNYVFKNFFLTFWKTVPRFRVWSSSESDWVQSLSAAEYKRTEKERTQAIIQVPSTNRK